MPNHPQSPVPREPIEVPHVIGQLTNREADQMLAQAESTRRTEIDNYWLLCSSDPVRAAQMAATSAPVVRDICLLAGSSSAIIPKPSDIDSLFEATTQLLNVEAIRNSLVGEYLPPVQATHVNAFWEDGQVVGLKRVNIETVFVLRYYGPMFNPGTVPETATNNGDHWFVACHQANDGKGGEFEFLTAHVIGTVSDEGRWKRVELDLETHSVLLRDLTAMETLVDRGRLADEYFVAKPLADFPTYSDVIIAQLNAHKAALRRAGAMPMGWQSIVEARTCALHDRIDQLRRRMKQMEEEMYKVRCRVQEVEACALEEETGFARGAAIRHKSTGAQGVLEIVYYGGAQFRLRDTTMYVTEDIRRGEWALTTQSNDPSE